MQLEFVPFENIDKNKWNGAIHFATNRNIFGYYWYLRSVIREWDAIIQGDYQSVMPVPRRVWTDFEISLLPTLGPYSINVLSKQCNHSFYTFWEEKVQDYGYRFNTHLTKQMAALDLTFQTDKIYKLALNDPYEVIRSRYDRELILFLDKVKDGDYVFNAQEIPEKILALKDLKTVEKNILFRLFYQTIQRSLGWHLKVTNTQTGKAVSAFFAGDQNDIYLIYNNASNDSSTAWVLLDMWVRNNAGKPVTLYILGTGFIEFGAAAVDILIRIPQKHSIYERLKQRLFYYFQATREPE
jgi:hypothetical protein